jgi:hypothetical protein
MLATLMLSCSTRPTVEPESAPFTEAPNLDRAVSALAFSTDGSTLFFARGVGRCVVTALEVGSGGTTSVRDLSFCPDRLTSFEDGSLLASSPKDSEWIASDGSTLFEGRTILAALDPRRLLERAGDGLVWTDGESSVRLDPVVLTRPRIVAGGVLVGIEIRAEGERLVRFDGPRPTAITRFFPAIDSWDAAPRGEEVVFSAKTESGFDVGIVSVSGGEISWVAPEPADERNVTWAPRGNKITYSFESVDATLVRSVHVPTSYQVMFDLPLTAVRQIAWEPRAERIAIVTESPGHGSGIDWIGYQGEGRANLVEAEDRVDSPEEILLWEGGSGVLLGPRVVRYGERRPTVLWIEETNPFGFRPEVARLRREGIPVLTTTSGRVGNVAAALAELPWFDSSTLYTVDVTGEAIGPDSDLQDTALYVRQGAGSRGREGVDVIPGDETRFRAAAVARVLSRVRETR